MTCSSSGLNSIHFLTPHKVNSLLRIFWGGGGNASFFLFFLKQNPFNSSKYAKTMTDFPKFPRSWHRYTPELAGGKDGTVYILSRDHVAKRPNKEVRLLERDHEVCEILYAHGRSVPKPEGLFLTALLDLRPGKFIRGQHPTFVMQNIHGIHGSHMRFRSDKHYRLRARVERLIEEEAQACEDLGFQEIDAQLSNSIYLPKEDKVVILDFCHWKTPD